MLAVLKYLVPQMVLRGVTLLLDLLLSTVADMEQDYREVLAVMEVLEVVERLFQEQEVQETRQQQLLLKELRVVTDLPILAVAVAVLVFLVVKAVLVLLVVVVLVLILLFLVLP